MVTSDRGDWQGPGRPRRTGPRRVCRAGSIRHTAFRSPSTASWMARPRSSGLDEGSSMSTGRPMKERFPGRRAAAARPRLLHDQRPGLVGVRRGLPQRRRGPRSTSARRPPRKSSGRRTRRSGLTARAFRRGEARRRKARWSTARGVAPSATGRPERRARPGAGRTAGRVRRHCELPVRDDDLELHQPDDAARPADATHEVGVHSRKETGDRRDPLRTLLPAAGRGVRPDRVSPVPQRHHRGRRGAGRRQSTRRGDAAAGLVSRLRFSTRRGNRGCGRRR